MDIEHDDNDLKNVEMGREDDDEGDCNGDDDGVKQRQFHQGHSCWWKYQHSSPYRNEQQQDTAHLETSINQQKKEIVVLV